MLACNIKSPKMPSLCPLVVDTSTDPQGSRRPTDDLLLAYHQHDAAAAKQTDFRLEEPDMIAVAIHNARFDVTSLFHCCQKRNQKCCLKKKICLHKTGISRLFSFRWMKRAERNSSKSHSPALSACFYCQTIRKWKSHILYQRVSRYLN